MQYLHEQVAHYGAENTSTSVLLALVLGDEKVARRLLKKFPTLRKLAAARATEWRQVKGMTPKRCHRLSATLWLGRRWSTENSMQESALSNPQCVFALFSPRLRDTRKEQFFACLLDCKNRPIDIELVSVGTANFAVVHPREVFAPAITAGAVSILMVHNHPSGDPTPSREDITLTKRLSDVGNMVGIPVIDHVIVGDRTYHSLREGGVL